MINVICCFIKLSIVIYLGILPVLASMMAVYQESKIWNSSSTLPSLNIIGIFKVFFFNVLWMYLCFIGSILMIIQYIISFGTADIGYTGNRIVEDFVGKCCLKLFVGTVQMNGIDNLPSTIDEGTTIPAPVYIANHASQLDIASIYYINKRFKWIAKKSVLFLPGVGTLMYMANHILIQRSSSGGGTSSSSSKKQTIKKSIKNLFEMADDSIQSGIPMLLFPQGTRRIHKKLPFKSGAFVIALKNCSPIIPISIEIPTNYNPWNTVYPFITGTNTTTTTPPTIIITIHPKILVQGNEDVQTLSDQCTDIIYSVLPPVYHNQYDESSKDK